MRTVGRLPDARMQITVFENDGRFPVQFERSGLSQIYRFRKGDGLENMGHLREIVGEEFRAAVLKQFGVMETIRASAATALATPPDPLSELPDIL